MNYLLNIVDLNVFIHEKKILDSLNLSIKPGEVHVIMGPNGVGKSTLAKVLTGNVMDYIVNGSIIYKEKNILNLSPDEISLMGMFLTFQSPPSILGLTNFQFFKSIINSRRKRFELNPIDSSELLLILRDLISKLDIKEEFLYRFVNDCFSGGEKKKNEALQMLLLKPDFVVLDEIDSGLDVDSLKYVMASVNNLKCTNNSFLFITHYNRILNYINVDYVHILYNGKIVMTGDRNLAFHVENVGYSNLE